MSTLEASVEKKASRWEDYVDIFFSPGELYARRANDSAAPAFWTLLVLAIVAYYAFLPANEMVIRASMEQARAQVEAQGGNAASVDGMANIMAYAGGLISAITYVISISLAALFLWLVARMVEVKGTYRQAFRVAVYAGFIYLLAQIAGSAMAMFLGEGLNPVRDLSFGLQRFFDPETLPKVVPALLRRTEIFFIWQAVVWAIGVRIVMGATKAQAAVTAAAAWLLFALPGVIGALLGMGQRAG